MRTVRWVDERSGFLIIVLGLSVLVCGSLGFASVDSILDSDGPMSMGTATASQLDNAQSPAGEQLPSPTKSPVRPARSLAGSVYETFQIFAFNVSADDLERSYLLRIAMVFAILLASLVAAKGIAILFHRSYEELGLRFKTGHVVVCGLGRIGRQVLADLETLKSEFQVVVIEPDPDNPNIAWAREMGAVVLIGDATRRELLEAARIQRAREVFVVTGSDECNIEAVIEIRDLIRRCGRQGRWGQALPRLRCHVHILSKDLAEIVRDKSNQLERLDSNQVAHRIHPTNEVIDVEVFNALERTARRLLEDLAADLCTKSLSDDTQSSPTKTQPRVIHYFLFGFDDFGQTLALKLAEFTHFPASTRVRMSIFDIDCQRKARQFVARYPAFCPTMEHETLWSFDDQADDWSSKLHRPTVESQLPPNSPGIEYVCNARFIDYSDITDAGMLQHMAECCTVSHVQPVVLVCFQQDRENFARAERLRAKLNSLGKDWPIFVWIPRQRELSQLLADQSLRAQPTAGSSCRLIPFGQCYGSVSYTEINDSWMDWLARHIQLVWIDRQHPLWQPAIGQLQTALNDPQQREVLRGMNWSELDLIAKRVWDSCSEWERASNRSCAVHSVLKAAVLGWRIVGYTTGPQSSPNHLSIPPAVDSELRKMEHYRWVAERLLAGWRHASTRDNTRKTRWQICPWDALESPPPAVQNQARETGKVINEKMKDELIVRLVIVFIELGLLQVSPLAGRGGVRSI
jgi:hypothetical protein